MRRHTGWTSYGKIPPFIMKLLYNMLYEEKILNLLLGSAVCTGCLCLARESTQYGGNYVVRALCAQFQSRLS